MTRAKRKQPSASLRKSLKRLSKDDLIDIIFQQQEQIDLLTQELSTLKERFASEVSLLKDQVASLEKRLARYENPHTPPSQQQDDRKNTSSKDKDKRKRPGGVVGHKGATRPIAEPEEREFVHMRKR